MHQLQRSNDLLVDYHIYTQYAFRIIPDTMGNMQRALHMRGKQGLINDNDYAIYITPSTFSKDNTLV